ncbi:hypothetical protein NQ314_013174 [Rhamnusium bicolor]|uniref:Uncharacterized protein n=1 Tax=Rhamnusium bicolor TaxID=1586634 RepID=A0AAV8X8R3_9CUCU|nr:hypothetical protein NQ314_013174 [Rhamnusium bicolor]
MVDIVVKWTNVKLASVRAKYKDEGRVDLKNTDQIEIKAYLGLLIYSAVFKSNDEDIECLFATDGTAEIFSER